MSEEREFRLEELFFSTTDSHGKVTSGNEVFGRVSGYSSQELIGAPHSIIRHPDMPRIVFRLMWSRIQSGQSVAAYVKNRAKDGTFYWVLAYITPQSDGYLSVRFKPTSEVLSRVDRLYQLLRERELEVENAGGRKEDAIEASSSLLNVQLAKLGYADYDSFIEAAFYEEYCSRSRLLAQRASDGNSQPQSISERFLSVAHICRQTSELLGTILHRQSDFLALDRSVVDTTKYVSKLTTDVRLASLNLAVKSSQCGKIGSPLTVIANWLSVGAAKLEREVKDSLDPMKRELVNIRRGLFRLSCSQLQLDMVTYFVHEMTALNSEQRGYDDVEGFRLIYVLSKSAESTFAESVKELRGLTGAIDRVCESFSSVSREVVGLGLVYTNGRVETVRLPDAASLQLILEDVMGKLGDARGRLNQLEDSLKMVEGVIHGFADHSTGIVDNYQRLLALEGA
jgi:PAS domain S-box-containing protein